LGGIKILVGGVVTRVWWEKKRRSGPEQYCVSQKKWTIVGMSRGQVWNEPLPRGVLEGRGTKRGQTKEPRNHNDERFIKSANGGGTEKQKHVGRKRE